MNDPSIGLWTVLGILCVIIVVVFLGLCCWHNCCKEPTYPIDNVEESRRRSSPAPRHVSQVYIEYEGRNFRQQRRATTAARPGLHVNASSSRVDSGVLNNISGGYFYTDKKKPDWYKAQQPASYYPPRGLPTLSDVFDDGRSSSDEDDVDYYDLPLYTDDPGWRAFKKRHMITYLQYPTHPQWNAEKWNKYLREQDISERTVNTIISVNYDDDVLEDFNPLDKKEQFLEEKPKGAVYKSRHPHTIYHMVPEKAQKGGKFKVYRDNDTHYVAGIRLMNDFGENRAVWVPIHFQSRYQMGLFDVRKSKFVR